MNGAVNPYGYLKMETAKVIGQLNYNLIRLIPPTKQRKKVMNTKKAKGYKGWVKGYPKGIASVFPQETIRIPMRLTRQKAEKALTRAAKKLQKQGMETIRHCYPI